jgi:hypothetical protein
MYREDISKVGFSIAAVIMVILLFIACIVEDSKNMIQEGYVVGKHYDKPRTTYIWAGKFVVPHHEPEHYVISIELEDKHYSGSVSKEFYMEVEIGDYVNLVTETKVVLNNA